MKPLKSILTSNAEKVKKSPINISVGCHADYYNITCTYIIPVSRVSDSSCNWICNLCKLCKNPSMLKFIIVENMLVILRAALNACSYACDPNSHGRIYWSPCGILSLNINKKKYQTMAIQFNTSMGIICDKIISDGVLLVLQQPVMPESEEGNCIPALVAKGENFLFKYASTEYCRHLR